MMRRCILFFLFLLFLPSPARAMEIYIHNKPLQGAPLIKSDEIYVPAEALKGLLKVPVSWDEKGIVTIDGRESTARILVSGGRPYLPLRAVATAAGYKLTVNRATGIVDVYRQAAVQPDAKPTPGKEPVTATPASSPAPTGAQGDDKLIITSKSSGDDFDKEGTAQGRRIYAEVTNGRATAARNVTARCILQQKDGAVFNQQDQAVGTLAPGEKKEVIFYFSSSIPSLKTVLTVRGE